MVEQHALRRQHRFRTLPTCLPAPMWARPARATRGRWGENVVENKMGAASSRPPQIASSQTRGGAGAKATATAAHENRHHPQFDHVDAERANEFTRERRGRRHGYQEVHRLHDRDRGHHDDRNRERQRALPEGKRENGRDQQAALRRNKSSVPRTAKGELAALSRAQPVARHIDGR
jgi:hypothetical protein